MSDTQNTSNPESEETITFTQGDVQFVGSILTAMTKQTQFATNAVEQSYIREIDQLREDFIFLYRRIQKIQTVAQRLDLEYVLEDHAYAYQNHQRPGWWSEDFNKNF
jgi:hypothetical protein